MILLIFYWFFIDFIDFLLKKYRVVHCCFFANVIYFSQINLPCTFHDIKNTNSSTFDLLSWNDEPSTLSFYRRSFSHPEQPGGTKLEPAPDGTRWQQVDRQVTKYAREKRNGTYSTESYRVSCTVYNKVRYIYGKQKQSTTFWSDNYKIDNNDRESYCCTCLGGNDIVMECDEWWRVGKGIQGLLVVGYLRAIAAILYQLSNYG